MKKLEEQSRTQDRSTNAPPKTIENVRKAGEATVSNAKQYGNFIAVGGLVIVSLVVSLITVQDGEVGILSFKGFTVYRYLLFFAQVLITPILSLIIMETLRKQGILYGKNQIRKTIDEYIDLESKYKLQARPRSEKQYNREQLVRNSISKFVFVTLFTMVTASVVLQGSINSLISVLVNIFMSLMFGFKQMIDAMQYVENELIIWYKERILEMRDEDDAPELPDAEEDGHVEGQ